VFSNFLFNPYSLIDFRNYIDEQISITNNEIYLPWPKGYSYVFDFSNEYYLGLFFVLAAIISVFYFLYKYLKNKKKEAIYFIIASYPIVYFGVFAFLPIFEHILIPIIPVLILMISKFIVDISDNIKNRWLRTIFLLFIIFCLLFQPGRYLFRRYLALKDYTNIENKASTIAGEEWVQNNIPNYSKIFIYGHMLDVPRIVDYRAEKQMELLMYSMYGLDDKPLFFESYKKVHEKIKNKKNTFHIEEMRSDNNNIFDYIIRNDFDYVISDYSKNLDAYPEFKKRKIIHFDSFDYLTGGSFSIYKMKLE
jgi:hypothetical protein